jgi:hypothetical protein
MRLRFVCGGVGREEKKGTGKSWGMLPWWRILEIERERERERESTRAREREKGIVVDGGLFGPFITTCHRPFINAGGRLLLFFTRLAGHHSGGWEDT